MKKMLKNCLLWVLILVSIIVLSTVLLIVCYEFEIPFYVRLAGIYVVNIVLIVLRKMKRKKS